MGIVNDIKETKKLKQRAVNLTGSEIEFILYLFSESMIPGKKLVEAVSAIEKLQVKYKELEDMKSLIYCSIRDVQNICEKTNNNGNCRELTT